MLPARTEVRVMTNSCIIPTRDRRELTLRALASVFAQETAAELEVIVVDDGSVDDTVQVIRQQYPAVRLVLTAGEGPGPARNAGAAAARGDFLMFLDSDDVWLPPHVRLLEQKLGQGFQVAYGLTQTFDTVNGAVFPVPALDEICEGDCLAALLRWCFFVPSALAVSREAFDLVGGFPAGQPGEDWAFFLKLAARYPFGFAGHEVISRRFLHQGSICRQVTRPELLASLARICRMLRSDELMPAAAQERFRQLGQWLLESKTDWSSVQAWYLAMKEEGIV